MAGAGPTPAAVPQDPVAIQKFMDDLTKILNEAGEAKVSTMTVIAGMYQAITMLQFNTFESIMNQIVENAKGIINPEITIKDPAKDDDLFGNGFQ